MNILLFRTDPSIMDIKNYNSQEIGMAKAYIAAGHSCDIVYYNGNAPTRIETIDAGNGKSLRIFWMKGFSILNNGFFPGIGKILKNYDMIQVSEYYFFASWYVYTRYAKKKRVYVYQGVYDADNSRKFKIRCKFMDPLMLTKKVLQNVQIFTKSNLASESMQRRGFKKVKTIGVGLDISRLKQPTKQAQWCKELESKKGKSVYLLYVGVLEDRRNILFMIDVLKKVVDQNNNVKLVMIGKGQQEYVNLCFEKIQQYHLEEYVIYKESLPQDELSSVYHVCDIFLLPTKYEIFGMVLLEAMSFGLPVISSYNGGSSTIIEDGKNGIIVRSFSEDEWAHQILNVAENDIMRSSISSIAKETAKERFSWSSIVHDILIES